MRTVFPTRSLRDEAVEKYHAIEEAALAGGEEQHGAGDFLRAAGAAKRQGTAPLPDEPFGGDRVGCQAAQPLDVDRARYELAVALPTPDIPRRPGLPCIEPSRDFLLSEGVIPAWKAGLWSAAHRFPCRGGPARRPSTG